MDVINDFNCTTKKLPVQTQSASISQVRKEKKITSVTGKKEGGILAGVAPLQKNYWDIFVSRLVVSTTADQVKRHLQENGVEVQDVFILNSKREGTKSAKVRVVLEHRNKAKDENVWPLHCRVQDWTPLSKSTRTVQSNDT